MSKRISRRKLFEGALAAGCGLVAGAGLARSFAVLRHRPGRNVLLIVADALRADRLGRLRRIDGSNASLTPAVDSLARDGLVFERAVAPSSWTPISMASLFYSVAPSRVSLTPSGLDVAMDPPGASLPAVLKGLGYYTAAVNANWVLDVPAFKVGFDYFQTLDSAAPPQSGKYERFPARAASAVADCAGSLARKLAAADSFFLYLHFMDTHEPYYCPDGVLRRLAASYNPYIFTAKLDKYVAEGSAERVAGLSPAEALDQLQVHYDAAALFLDGAIGRLLKRMDETGLLDDTLVIFTSDHGEEFGDNEEDPVKNVGHAHNLTFPEIHSPLVAWGRGLDSIAGRTVSVPVSMAAAVVDLVKWHAAAGTSPLVSSVIAGVEPPSAAVLSVLNYVGRFNGFSLVDGSLKLHGRFDPAGAPVDVRAFRAAASGSLVETPVPDPSLRLVASLLAGKNPRAFDPDALDETQKDKFRALGYLN